MSDVIGVLPRYFLVSGVARILMGGFGGGGGLGGGGGGAVIGVATVNHHIDEPAQPCQKTIINIDFFSTPILHFLPYSLKERNNVNELEN